MISGRRTVIGAGVIIALLSGCSTTVDESTAPERLAQIKKNRELVRTTIQKDAKALGRALGGEVVAVAGHYRVNTNMGLSRPDIEYTADAVIRMPVDAPKPYSFSARAALVELGYEPTLQFSTAGGGGGHDERDGLTMGYGESSRANYRDLTLSLVSDDVEVPESVVDDYRDEAVEPIIGDPGEIL